MIEVYFGLGAAFFLILTLALICRLHAREIDKLIKRVNALEQDGWQ